jgi:hypothetical protein
MQEPTSLGCALRTLYEEIAEYRFDYPVMMVPEAGPKESLHFYLVQVLEDTTLPERSSAGFKRYSPGLGPSYRNRL